MNYTQWGLFQREMKTNKQVWGWMGPGGGRGQGLKGTVHIFSPTLGRCSPGSPPTSGNPPGSTNSQRQQPDSPNPPAQASGPAEVTNKVRSPECRCDSCPLSSVRPAAQVQSGSCVVLPSVPRWGRKGGSGHRGFVDPRPCTQTLCSLPPATPHSTLRGQPTAPGR